jgi:hypothetical protein
MQGLNYNGLKRNRAKIKEKGPNRKCFVSAEGYTCEYQKTWGWGVSAKFIEPAGIDWLTRVDQMRAG